MSASKNQLATRLQLEGLNRDQRTRTDGPVMQYSDLTGRPRAVPGDDESAWLKSPPFLTNQNAWLEQFAFTDALDPQVFAATDEAECQDYRLLTAFFAFTLGDDGETASGQLSVIAEARGVVGQVPRELVRWYPLAVLDPSVSYVTLTGFGNGFGQRTFAPAVLQSPAFTGGANRVVSWILTWDVSVFAAVRLRLLATVPGLQSLTNPPKLDLDYALAL